MLSVLLVGLGGFVGSVLRYGASGWAQSMLGPSAFPFGTLFVNVVGCLAIGFLAGWAETNDALGEQAQRVLFVGVLGGFTTFSAFSHQTIMLLRDGQAPLALANVGLQLTLCLAAAACGYLASQAV